MQYRGTYDELKCSWPLQAREVAAFLLEGYGIALET